MKRITFFKSLLFAAGLMVGGNAWANVTPYSESYSSTSTTNGWSTATSGRFTPVILNEDENYYLSVDQDQRNNNGTTVTGTVVEGKAAAGDNFTITFDMKLSNSGGNNAQSPVSFTINDAANSSPFFSLTATGASVKTFFINGTTTQITLPDNAQTAIASCTWCSYKITRSGSDTYLTITNKATNSVIFSQAAVSGSSTSGGLGKMVFVTKRYNANFAIDNIVVREVEASDIPSTYTATFTDNTSGNNVSGTTTIYSDSERSSVVSNGSLEDGQTYYFTATQADYYDYQGSFTVSGANPSVSFSMIKHPSYTINATAGGSTIATFASGYAAEGASYRTYIPKAVKFNGSYYVLDDDANENLNEFLVTYTMGSTDEVRSINYTLDASIVFYAEYEDISTKVASYEYFGDRSSKGASKALYGSNTMTTTMNTTKDGIYNVVLVGGNRDGSHTLTMNMKLKDSEGNISEDNVISQYMAGGAWIGEMTAKNVRVPAGSEFYIEGDGNTTNRFVIDYIIVRKVADVEDLDNEFVGAFDMSTTANGAVSANYSLKKGDAVKYNFQNHGQDYGKNWRILVKEGETWRSVTCGDFYDYTQNKATLNPYEWSVDGGNTRVRPDNVWVNFAADMADAEVNAVLTYGTDGTLTINATVIGGETGTIYYIDNEVPTSGGELTVNLSVNESWLEVLSTEQTAVGGTIASSGYSSLASAYGLDFANATGLTTAYVVPEITSSSVKLASVDELPANSGVILKGEGGAAYSIPVKADATYAGENKLKAAVTAYECAANEVYILQSGQFHLVTAASTVPAGKAYLLAEDVPAAARALKFAFDDDNTTTGISSIDNGQMIKDNVYNLKGQRVNNPTKGLYIVNGTKVIIK